jgi:acetyltransferase EpsM
MGNKLYLYGASGHCKVIIDILKSNNESVEIILDDNPKILSLLGIPVVHASSCTDLIDKKVLITIGDNSVRKEISKGINTHFHITIHAKAIVSAYATVGPGTVVMAGAIINAATSIGKHCIVNSGAVIEHDCVVQDFVHISPNVSLAGDVTVGTGSHVGIGTSVIQGIKIGKWSIIGAGAVIIKDVPDYAVVVGNPGKIIKFKEKK